MSLPGPADGVLGYHLSPYGCGVGKFNSVLAARLGVPLLQVFDARVARLERPLLSVKIAELSQADHLALDGFVRALRPAQSLRLFLHAFGDTALEERLVRRADLVWCGNPEIVAQLRHVRPDAVEAWCPGSLLGATRFVRPEISVFSFGMAHKVRTRHYRRLRELLEATGRSFAVYLSTALHEGTSFDDEFTAAFEDLQELFDGRVYFLGFLSDAALFNQMCDATFVAAFFEGGVRTNNTSVNSAMECGAVVITNLDASSPADFVHMESVVDVERCTALPLGERERSRIGAQARVVAARFGWDNLIRQLGRAPSAAPGDSVAAHVPQQP